MRTSNITANQEAEFPLVAMEVAIPAELVS